MRLLFERKTLQLCRMYILISELKLKLTKKIQISKKDKRFTRKEYESLTMGKNKETQRVDKYQNALVTFNKIQESLGEMSNQKREKAITSSHNTC